MTMKRRIKMKIYICGVCGYAYEENEGDVSQNVEAGTKWENVSDSWVCPLCGVGKDEFNEA